MIDEMIGEDLEVLETNELNANELGDVASERLDYMMSGERMHPENWTHLSSTDKLEQLKIASSKYGEASGNLPLKIGDFEANTIPSVNPSTVAFFNGREILFDHHALEANKLQSNDAVAAIVRGYIDGKNISFGGLRGIEGIADQQKGGTCWLEACENFIQTHAGFCVDNDFSNRLYDQVVSNPERYGAFLTPGVVEGHIPEYAQEIYNIPHEAYPQLIHDTSGVHSSWQEFSHEKLQENLIGNKGILLVGMASPLSAEYAMATNAHAFMITDFRNGEYIGIDSNFPGQESHWTPEQIETSLNMFGPPQMLVPEGESTWQYKTDTLAEMGKNLDSLVASDMTTDKTVGSQISFGGSCSHCDNDIKNTKYSWWVCKEN